MYNLWDKINTTNPAFSFKIVTPPIPSCLPVFPLPSPPFLTPLPCTLNFTFLIHLFLRHMYLPQMQGILHYLVLLVFAAYTMIHRMTFFSLNILSLGFIQAQFSCVVRSFLYWKSTVTAKHSLLGYFFTDRHLPGFPSFLLWAMLLWSFFLSILVYMCKLFPRLYT